MRRAACLLLALACAAPALAQYRWTGPDGSTQYGDTPPRDARNVQPLNPKSAAPAATRQPIYPGEPVAPPPAPASAPGARPAPAPGTPTSALPFELRRAAERYPATLYVDARCGAPCAEARAYLRGRGVPYQEVLIETREDIEAFRARTGADAVPTLSVGTLSQSGYERGAWAGLLDAAGYPASSQLPPNYAAPGVQPLGAPPAAAAPAR
jgi:hypothetical protein